MSRRSPDEAPAAGPAAARAGSAAASLLLEVARVAGEGPHAAQARALQERLDRLATSDADALAAARDALADDERRDFALGQALDRAAGVPLEIAEACADVAALARELEPDVLPELAPDVRAAALLAGGAARAAAHLVEVNLGVAAGDQRLARAQAAVAAADGTL